MGMTTGMNAEKIAVSLSPELLRKVRTAVKAGRASSVSAYVSRALENETKLESLDALLDEMLESSGGPATPAERRTARKELRSAFSRR